MFKIGVQINTGNISKGFEKVVNHARDTMIRAMKENIDARAKGSWVEDGGVLTKGGSANQYMISNSSYGPKQYVEILQNMYVEAFKNRYRAIQESHRVAAPQPEGEQWVEAKKGMGGKPSPWNHKTVGQHVENNIDYSIMTGFLRHSILQVFSGEATNKYFEFDNPMLRGAWRFNIENYNFRGFNYVQKITEYFINELGILDGEKDLTDLPDAEIQRIGGRMLDFLEGGFAEDFMKYMREMDIEITPE